MTKSELNSWCAKYRGWTCMTPDTAERWTDGTRTLYTSDLPRVSEDICLAVTFRHECGLAMTITQERVEGHMLYTVQCGGYIVSDRSEAYATVLAIYKAVEGKE